MRLHEDPALFREAVSFTAAETGFAPRLIEKDYFCTVLLQHLTAAATDLVFRGVLLDPISGSRMAAALPVRCLSRAEAMAEKARAALSRREVAIRDFYDIDHAVRRLGLRLHDPELVGLVKQKLAIPGNEPVDVSEARLAALKAQLPSELKPVLRDRDFSQFDLERAFATVAQLARAVA